MSMYKTSFPTISLTGHIHSIFIKKYISREISEKSVKKFASFQPTI